MGNVCNAPKKIVIFVSKSVAILLASSIFAFSISLVKSQAAFAEEGVQKSQVLEENNKSHTAKKSHSKSKRPSPTPRPTSTPTPTPTAAPCVTSGTNLPAVSVKLNASGYLRSYSIAGVGNFTGNQTLSLVPGTYELETGVDKFDFSVDSCGQVVPNCTSCAIGGANTLALQTSSVTIDPGTFTRVYIPNHGSKSQGIQAITSIIGLMDSVTDAAGADISVFTVNPDGTISPVTGGNSITTSAGKVTFKNIQYAIDPGSFSRSYLPIGGTPLQGKNTLIGIANAHDGIQDVVGADIAQYYVADDGSFNVVIGQSSVSTVPGTLSFLTTLLSIDPSDFDRPYIPTGGVAMAGINTIVSIQNGYERIDDYFGAKLFDMTISSTDAITMISGQAGALITQGKLTFSTVKINIDPGQYTRGYLPVGGRRLTGSNSISCIIGAYERLNNDSGNEIVSFLPAADGTITPVDGSAALFSAGIIQFHNVRLDMNPGSYTGSFGLAGGQAFSGGPASDVAIPSTEDQIITSDQSSFMTVNANSVNVNGYSSSNIGPDHISFTVTSLR